MGVRDYSVPERLTMIGLTAGAIAGVWPTVTRTTGVSVLCPLRTLTGIPCPFCGMTTAATALVAGELRTAVLANPFVLGLAALVLAVLPVLAARTVGLAGPPSPWPDGVRRRTQQALCVLAFVSWLYQLHRFGWF
ncbi:MAG TPA: DUF2752 domain-containing protein [Micromonosporaceae bacterium]|nr:DUF2752 domain-containing protein [Micromonosporaceae bacterium]